MTSFTSIPRGLLGKLLLVAVLNDFCSAIDSLQVKTTVGVSYGIINGTSPHVAQFLGIPYAEPPVGPLRWAAPVPKSPQHIIDATRFGASCPQIPDPYAPDVYTADVQEYNTNSPTSEDCLNLNVWAPFVKHSRKLPVVVWIFGGGFQAGGLDVEYQIPSQWVERTQSHIVVAINYRLNIFGFPNAAGQPHNEYNVGLLDQRLALEWVRSNIDSFGGDPSRITLWGQSAGASSVDYYNFAYINDPIVRGLIMDSGTALHPTMLAPDPSHSNFTSVAKQFGCGGLKPGAELQCMRKISFVDIENFLQSGKLPSLNFSPVPDDVVVFSDYTARALAGKYTKLPAIIGSNSNEGVSLVRYSPGGVNMEDANYNTLSHFTCPAVQAAKDRHSLNVPTFRYLYAGNFTNISPRPWQSAYHASELPMIFGTSGIARGKSTPFQVAVSEAMQDMWLAFITSGTAGLNRRRWHAHQPGGSVLEFGSGDEVMRYLPNDDFEKICDGIEPLPGSVPPKIDL
ncbi:related to triacylglycerol lipase V precursor [Rhynchosporium secalis]|uniref:Carboxylic ester hydrolase n=1 Tax=Rhynchosporium secalis TaxID=38038 RepID=A0A1E1MGJ4_RHYSE|nr:related to triacylglycerol lipase V precursor [Rhynchosporium secalis]